jgi:CheB methylesterase
MGLKSSIGTSADSRHVGAQRELVGNSLPAVYPADIETFGLGRIYVAPPDRQLLLEGERVLVKDGPKGKRFRPSVDALFLSAARLALFGVAPR